MEGFNVAIVGATGMVGREMKKVLEERNFPVKKLLLLASARSKGKKMVFRGKEIPVEVLKEDSFRGIDYALFSAGGSISKKFGPLAAATGTVVIDNSSAFRMDDNVPLVVPEVNMADALKHRGIIANPNCSTIQLVVVLKPIYDRVGIIRLVVSTYQAVSGWGKEAVDQLWRETGDVLKQGKHRVETKDKALPWQIAFNLIPQIDVFLENRYSKEEIKVVNETRKILGDEKIKITCTAVRVPVVTGHTEAVNIETGEKISVSQTIELLMSSPGVKVVDDPSRLRYPMPIDAEGIDDVLVGRIREDESIPRGLNMVVVGDNLRKGAALNAAQIAESLIKIKRSNG